MNMESASLAFVSIRSGPYTECTFSLFHFSSKPSFSCFLLMFSNFRELPLMLFFKSSSSGQNRSPHIQADEFLALPVLCGLLRKKSPSLRRSFAASLGLANQFEQRFFVLRDMRLLWYANEKDASDDKPCKG